MSSADRPLIPTSVILAIAACPVRVDYDESDFRQDLVDQGVTWIQEVTEVCRDDKQWITKHRMTLAHVEQHEVLSLDWFGIGASYEQSIENARETFAACQIGTVLKRG